MRDTTGLAKLFGYREEKMEVQMTKRINCYIKLIVCDKGSAPKRNNCGLV